MIFPHSLGYWSLLVHWPVVERIPIRQKIQHYCNIFFLYTYHFFYFFLTYSFTVFTIFSMFSGVIVKFSPLVMTLKSSLFFGSKSIIFIIIFSFSLGISSFSSFSFKSTASFTFNE